ncbi:glycosyltransferase [Pseudoclavibacter sp. JSM 162008]|uniref:glycosyltransferase n=1 Tax=Pseudoclavibacter sp. JSM 162008 TaxID=3229855 RepID=UPI00352538B5
MTSPVPPRGQFTVIIPTLQKSDLLREVVLLCSNHALVREVLVINNAPEHVTFPHQKPKVIKPEKNIYVNPAWNLGAELATSEYLVLVNDDVTFDPIVFDELEKILGLGMYGIVGPDRSAFSLTESTKPGHGLARPSATIFGYGTFMAMRRKDYVPIPEEMRIWGGDDWLILNQRRPPAALTGIRFSTEMGTSSSSPEAQALRAEEQETADRLLAPLHNSRPWHRMWRLADKGREIRHSIRTRLGR